MAGAVYIHGKNRAMVDTATQNHTDATKQYSQTGTGNASGVSPSKESATTSSGSTSSNASGLPSPSGQLLSKHTVSLSSPSPQTNASEESVCQSVANANCQIVASLNGRSVMVAQQSTGSNGMVIMDWSAKTAGLTA